LAPATAAVEAASRTTPLTTNVDMAGADVDDVGVEDVGVEDVGVEGDEPQAMTPSRLTTARETRNRRSMGAVRAIVDPLIHMPVNGVIGGVHRASAWHDGHGDVAALQHRARARTVS
jgi:hypothetical protein